MQKFVIFIICLFHFSSLGSQDAKVCYGSLVEPTGKFSRVVLKYSYPTYGNVHDEVVDVFYFSQDGNFDAPNITPIYLSEVNGLEKTQVDLSRFAHDLILDVHLDHKTRKIFNKPTRQGFKSTLRGYLVWTDTGVSRVYKLKCDIF